MLNFNTNKDEKVRISNIERSYSYFKNMWIRRSVNRLACEREATK